jgi:hypothetical protein
MGKTIMGSSGNQSLLTKPQQQLQNQFFQYGPQAAEAFGQFVQPYDPAQFESLFQKAFVDPAMLQYERSVLPAIQQRFVDQGGGSSSALNQALAQSATDVSTMLGSQMGQFYQGQQANQLNAINALLGLSNQRTFQPYQQQGILGGLLGLGGQVGAAYLGR